MGSPQPLAIDSEEIIEQAVRLRCAREGTLPAQVVHDILRKALAPEIDELSGAVPLAAVIQNVMRSGAQGSKGPGTSLEHPR